MTHDTPDSPAAQQDGQPEHDTPASSFAAVRVYPVARGDRIDHRFTDHLLCDVADVLADHGYPVIDPSGGDYEELGWTLRRFIFGSPAR